MMVAADLMRRGHKIAFPYGEDWDYDLIVCRDEKLERPRTAVTTSRPLSSGMDVRTFIYG